MEDDDVAGIDTSGQETRLDDEDIRQALEYAAASLDDRVVELRSGG